MKQNNLWKILFIPILTSSIIPLTLLSANKQSPEASNQKMKSQIEKHLEKFKETIEVHPFSSFNISKQINPHSNNELIDNPKYIPKYQSYIEEDNQIIVKLKQETYENPITFLIKQNDQGSGFQTITSLSIAEKINQFQEDTYSQQQKETNQQQLNELEEKIKKEPNDNEELKKELEKNKKPNETPNNQEDPIEKEYNQLKTKSNQNNSSISPSDFKKITFTNDNSWKNDYFKTDYSNTYSQVLKAELPKELRDEIEKEIKEQTKKQQQYRKKYNDLVLENKSQSLKAKWILLKLQQTQTKITDLQLKLTSPLLKTYTIRTKIPNLTINSSKEQERGNSLSASKQVVFEQTFKIKNNLFNLSLLPSPKHTGAYFNNQVLWFDSSQFTTPFPTYDSSSQHLFPLETNLSNNQTDYGFFVNTLITDQFAILRGNFQDNENEVYTYDLTKIIKTDNKYNWPSPKKYSYQELQNHIKDSNSRFSSTKELLLVVFKNKKTNLSQFHLLQSFPSLNNESEIKKFLEFFKLTDFTKTKKDYEQKIKELTEKIKKQQSFLTKKQLEKAKNNLESQLETLESTLPNPNFKSYLPFYLKTLQETNQLENNSINETSSETLSNTINSFLIPLTNQLPNSSKNLQIHPKSSFFQYLKQSKKLDEKNIQSQSYFQLYANYQEYLTYLANKTIDQKPTKPILIKFDSSKIKDLKSQFTTPSNNVQDINKLFESQIISLFLNDKKIKNNELEELKKILKIRKYEMSNNKKELLIEFQLENPSSNNSSSYILSKSEFIFDLEEQKEITDDIFNKKLIFNEQKIKSFINQFSKTQFIKLLRKKDFNLFLEEKNSFLSNGLSSLTDEEKEQLKKSKIDYDFDTYLESEGKTLKFTISSNDYSFGSYSFDNLSYLGDIFQNTKPNYIEQSKNIIEINLYEELKEDSSKPADENKLKELIKSKIESWLKENNSSLTTFQKTSDSITNLTQENLKKLQSNNQTSIEQKRKDFIEIELSSIQDENTEPSPLLSSIKEILDKNKLIFRFTNIKPFDVSTIQFEPIQTNINTLFSNTYTEFELNHRYETLMKDFKQEIFRSLASQIESNKDKLKSEYTLEDFIKKDSNSSLFKFKIIPKNKDFTWKTNNFEYDENEEKVFHKELENLFYPQRKVNLEILLPEYLKQYYLNTDKLTLSIQNNSPLSKLIDFSQLETELDQSLEKKYPNWKQQLNQTYKETFNQLAIPLRIPFKESYSSSDFLKINPILLKNIVFSNEHLIKEKLQPKIIELKQQLQSKTIDNNYFLVEISKIYSDFYGQLINNLVKKEISTFTKLIDSSYDENWFNIEEFISKEKEYKLDINKLFSFLLPKINFKKFESITKLNISSDIKKNLHIIPYQLKSGHTPFAFGKTSVDLNLLFNKEEIFDLSWTQYILDSNNKVNNFVIPKNLKDFLYKKYSLSDENNPEKVVDPDNPNGDSVNDNKSNDKNNNPNNPLKQKNKFDIKQHLFWLIPLSLISIVGLVFLILYLIKNKKKKPNKNLKDKDEDDNASNQSKINIIDILKTNNQDDFKKQVLDLKEQLNLDANVEEDIELNNNIDSKPIESNLNNDKKDLLQDKTDDLNDNNNDILEDIEDDIEYSNNDENQTNISSTLATEPSLSNYSSTNKIETRNDISNDDIQLKQLETKKQKEALETFEKEKTTKKTKNKKIKKQKPKSKESK